MGGCYIFYKGRGEKIRGKVRRREKEKTREGKKKRCREEKKVEMR